jgi:hypothetical protein
MLKASVDSVGCDGTLADGVELLRLHPNEGIREGRSLPPTECYRQRHKIQFANEFRSCQLSPAAEYKPMRNIVLILAFLVPFTVVAESPGVIVNQDRLDRLSTTAMPVFHEPVFFDSELADAILSALEIYPPDNPWNIPVDTWPVADNSDAMIKAIGADKPLRGNNDMAFVLVPPNQKQIDVKLSEYPATHFASSKTDPNLPRMGKRFRLRKIFETSRFSPEVRIILEALKRYGMLNADK